MDQPPSAFHTGEIEAQRRAGTERRAAESSRFIRDHMPQQHREFFAALPFVIVAGADGSGRPWVSILESEDGFAAPTERSLALPGQLGAGDPLAAAFVPGASLGLLGIELATRRRNRLNGRLRRDALGLVLEVDQSFGNCPQYIREREWRRVDLESGEAAPARVSDSLDQSQVRRIRAADTFFIGSGFSSGEGRFADGFDASHRGGEPGFVEIDAEGNLIIPDYSGNNYFNTIGNLLRDPRVGLLFVDFESGGLLHLTGRAKIVWDGGLSHDPDARRVIVVTVDKVVDRPGALALRWQAPDRGAIRLRLVDKVVESPDITSFHLVAADGGRLAGFAPGQHLPVDLQVPGHLGRVRRTYSLSGPAEGSSYRISVQREAGGIASSFLHDHLRPGDVIEAHPPSGDFVAPEGEAPLVLVSAGVGVTPMLAILHAIADAPATRRLWFVHGARDGETHAFRQEVAELVARAQNVQLRVFYSAPRDEDRQRASHQGEGRLTAEHLIALGAGPGADYMICGPAPFIAALSEGLERLGVPPDRIHHETFGPAG